MPAGTSASPLLSGDVAVSGEMRSAWHAAYSSVFVPNKTRFHLLRSLVLCRSMH